MPDVEIVEVGTKALATSAMLHAGAHAAATGESAVLYNCQNCDVIAGAMGIAFAHSMHGEISPAIASAVSRSAADKILVPMAKCLAQVVGVEEKSLGVYFSEVVDRLKTIQNQR